MRVKHPPERCCRFSAANMMHDTPESDPLMRRDLRAMAKECAIAGNLRIMKAVIYTAPDRASEADARPRDPAFREGRAQNHVRNWQTSDKMDAL
jgi:hypothetical protein